MNGEESPFYFTLNECVEKCIDARVMMADIRRSVPENHIVGKAAEASERLIEVTWELIDRERSKEHGE